MGYTVKVTGISPATTEDKLNDFFSFCGKLLSVQKTDKEATLVFEKSSAAKTALMLNGGTVSHFFYRLEPPADLQLDGAHLEVTSDLPPTSSILPTNASASTPIGAKTDSDGSILQEDKPKAAIVAEYLAHGYVVGDHIIQRAIDMDHQSGISAKFLSFIHSFDKTVGEKVVGPEQTVSGKLNETVNTAINKTKEVDANRGVSSKLNDYYSKVLSTPIGQKVHTFYTSTSKQVLDVHEEARRIADEKKAASATSTPVTASSVPVIPAMTEASTTTASPAVPVVPSYAMPQ